MAELHEFSAMGHRVARRLAVNDAMRWANRTVAATAGILLVLLLLTRLTGGRLPAELAVLLAGIALWGMAVLVRAWRRWPTAYEALARWDEASEDRRSLASAEFFAGLPERSPGQSLHLERAKAVLDERVGALPRDLPRERPRAAWVALGLVLLGLAVPVGRSTLRVEDRALTEEMRKAAEAEVAALEARRKTLADLEALEEEERREVEELGQLLDETSAMLSEPGSRSSREVLDALEARAQAAEAMAAGMGQGEEWLSQRMIEPLEENADTAALAEAIRDQDAHAGADESSGLAQRLEQEEGRPLEERLEVALERSVQQATEEDLRSSIGQHLSGALNELQNQSAPGAASEFRALTRHLQRMAQRDLAQKQLEAIAGQLREAGAEIAGGQLEAMRELAAHDGAEAPAGAEPLADQAPAATTGAGQGPGQGEAPGTVAGPPPPGGIPPGMNAAPIPGMAPPGGTAFTAPIPGEMAAAGGPPGLSAPVPGQAGAPGQGGNSPVPGLQAGTGTAAMKPNATTPMGAARDELVEAQAGEEGAAYLKKVESERPGQERARRSSRAGAAEFLAVEEQALDEKALPVSRQDQVQRYFNALRRQFEAGDE